MYKSQRKTETNNILVILYIYMFIYNVIALTG